MSNRFKKRQVMQETVRKFREGNASLSELARAQLAQWEELIDAFDAVEASDDEGEKREPRRYIRAFVALSQRYFAQAEQSATLEKMGRAAGFEAPKLAPAEADESGPE